MLPGRLRATANRYREPGGKQTPFAEVFCELSLFCVDGDSVYFYFIVDGDDEAFSAVDDLNIDKI